MMADEGLKARLVRCPKCDSLLTELPNYSGYQCGGCGAFLRAKKKVAGNGGLLENLEKESLSEKEDGSHLDIASEAERESYDGVFIDRRNERIFKERTVNWVNGSCLRIQNKDSSIDSGNRIVKEKILGNTYKFGAEKGIGYTDNDRYRLPLKHPIGNWVDRDDNEMNMNRSDSVNSGKGKGIGEISAQCKLSTGPLMSKTITGKWDLDRNGLEGPYGNFKMAGDPNQFPQFAYPGEGPSNYHLRPSTYGYGKNFDDLNRPNRFTQLEQDRAELLRKLDELKEQIYRSDTVAEKQRKGTFLDVKIAPPGAYHDHVTRNNVSVKPLAPDTHVPRVPFFKQYDHGHEPVLHTNSYDMDMQNLYFHAKHVANEFPVYQDPIQLQMPKGNSHHPPGQYQWQTPHDYLLAKHMDFNQERRAFYPHRTLDHKPSCSCFHCYNRNQHILSEVKSQNRSLPATPALRSQDPRSHARWPSNFDSEMDAFHQGGIGKTMALSHGNRRLCHPIAGGAPFTTCCHCFELLKLPRKLKAKENNELKLRCGACSTLLLFEIKTKQLIISVLVQNTQILAGANGGSRDISKVVSSSDGGFSGEGMNCFIDFDSPGYDLQSTDFKRNIQSEDQRLNLSEFEKRQGFSSVSSVSSEEEESLDGMIVQRDISYIYEHAKDNASPTFQGSHFAQNMDDIAYNHEANRYVEGNKSNKTDQEKATLDKSASEKNSEKDVSSETEVEVSFNEYLNTSLSQDSMVVSKEDRSRINKGNESFLVGLLKKSFRDFSRSSHHIEDAKPNVYVNGHLIPDNRVKHAERLAGPVRPGDYWYDFQAGFWGVMGQPCLGIIPPCIKEFNYPMPENCAAGNTGVFVNGRELHQKDLDLLTSRGLPTTKEKSYIIDISGRVRDKDSGKELKSLGKLAPTVLKLNRGFGMKVPKKQM